MTNIKDLFVPYEQALELKELGFDEPCFIHYYKGDLMESIFGQFRNSYFNLDEQVSVPLYQQAFRWFREKYGLRISNYLFVNMSGGISEGFTIFKYSKDTICRVESLTYEEAELACLIKLIEIVKTNQHGK